MTKPKSKFIKELKKPVTILSILALLVSLATIYFLIKQVNLQAEQTRLQNAQTEILAEQSRKIEENEREQNSKWDALNKGHLEVVDIDFQIFKEIDAEKLNEFPQADLVGKCVVFNIGGNKYRLITKIEFLKQQIYVKFILTHKEYDKNTWKELC
jgi:K+-sensing histidine kinase KdpD